MSETSPPSPCIGVISDTHGQLRPEAVEALRGCTRILHAGDVGRSIILEELNRVAPTLAVRGNVDHGSGLDALPESQEIEVAGSKIYMRHIRETIPFDPTEKPFSLIIYGHSHRPEIIREKGIIYFNPGSAGPRRFRLPVTVGKIWVTAQGLEPELLTLEV